MVQKLLSDPDIDTYLRDELDCTVITVNGVGDTTTNEAGEGRRGHRAPTRRRRWQLTGLDRLNAAIRPDDLALAALCSDSLIPRCAPPHRRPRTDARTR